MLNSKYYKQALQYENNHNRPYPPHNGAIHWSNRRTKLPVGTVIDRYGNPKGRYVSPYETPIDYSSLIMAKMSGEYHVYEVVTAISAEESFIAPWFGQPGGGIQYRLKPIEYYISRGRLREIVILEQ